MVTDDINDGIVRLESKKSHLVSLIDTLNKAKKEQTDMNEDFESLIIKLKNKISKTDRELQELCDYAVEIAMAESDVYEAMYQADDTVDIDINSYIFM